MNWKYSLSIAPAAIAVAAGAIAGQWLISPSEDRWWTTIDAEMVSADPDRASVISEHEVAYLPDQGLALERLHCESTGDGVSYFVEVNNPYAYSVAVIALLGTTLATASTKVVEIEGAELVEIPVDPGNKVYRYKVGKLDLSASVEKAECTAEVYGIDEGQRSEPVVVRVPGFVSDPLSRSF